MADSSPPSFPPCKRCRATPGIYNLRSESTCATCYTAYVRSKTIKRLESYKIRTTATPVANSHSATADPPLFLLPLSFSISSTCLLQILGFHLARQREKKVTRAKFRLKVIHIDEGALTGNGGGDGGGEGRGCEVTMERYRMEFGASVESFKAVKLETVYSDTGEDSANGADSATERLRRTFSALPTPTARMDLAQILRTRLLSKLAAESGCHGVLWGDSTTRLAEKTLAETAKGRGSALPFLISDGPTPDKLKQYYPLRDVFRKELCVYGEINELSRLCGAWWEKLPKHSAERAVSGRNITVDELLVQYCEGMEESYPSIVSNVVRTAGRLGVLPAERGREGPAAAEEWCRICGLPRGDGGGAMVLGEVEKGKAGGEGEGEEMCYGCRRATVGIAEGFQWPVI